MHDFMMIYTGLWGVTLEICYNVNMLQEERLGGLVRVYDSWFFEVLWTFNHSLIIEHCLCDERGDLPRDGVNSNTWPRAISTRSDWCDTILDSQACGGCSFASLSTRD